MPAEIDAETRSRIVYYTALGYTQQEVGEAVGVSRNTVRKYRRKTREVVEDAEDPQRRLCAIIEGEYDWDRGEGPDELGVGYMSM